MGMYDRDYWKEDKRGSFSLGGTSLYLPKPTRVVLTLIAINVVIYLFQLATAKRIHLTAIFGATADDWMQVWRYFTFQFLHDTKDIWHILMNMIGLYLFGGAVEKRLGVRKFLTFYLLCGVAAGLAYVTVVVASDLDRTIPIVGASGGVYALMIACAVYEPGLRFFGIFPIRPTVAVVVVIMVLMVVAGLNEAGRDPKLLSKALSDTAHLGGIFAAAIWLFVSHRAAGLLKPASSEDLPDGRRNPNPGGWQRKMQRKQEQSEQVNRILDKIHSDGIDSLSEKEKKILRDETERQRRQDMENKQ